MKTYRDYIYNDYGYHFKNVEISDNFNKEKELHYRYYIKNYMKYLPKDKSSRILDVGCGKGTCLAFCVRIGYNNSEGIDLSKANVEFCKQQGLHCQQIDALSYLAKNTETFDVIIFNDVIEHLRKDEIFEMLIAMQNALKTEGIIIVKTLNMANPYVGSANLCIDFTHEVGFTEISFKQVFHALSFRSIEVFGMDIYVSRGGVINNIAKIIAKVHCFYLFLVSCLYGRKSIRIFNKNIVCVAKK